MVKHGAPKLVDKTMPGHSFQISRFWSQLLGECCIYSKDNVLRQKSDIYDLLFQKDLQQVKDCIKPLDIKVILELMKKCGISNDDIENINKVWNLDITNEGGR